MARALLVLVLCLALPAGAGAQSLPQVDAGSRPGPDLLYEAPSLAPQLDNAGVWSAAPILVSGASAYRQGEFLYQDFLYDDHGARGTRDPTDPFSSEEFAFAPKYGTLTYPTDSAFANNAADLVELRVKPLSNEIAFRVTLNSLADPDRTAFTIALGSSAEPRAWPHGAGARSPATQFLTVHGTSAELRDAATDAVVTPAPSASVDATRRQFDVRVPRAAWDPGTGTMRMAAGVGLWDGAGDGYLAPQAVASATTPGGAALSGAALFNVAFRSSEPKPEVANPAINTIAEGSVGAGADGSYWRERAQAEALADGLADGDVTSFSAQVDFGKLAAGTGDESGVPAAGHINRILSSRFSFGQGVNHDKDCSQTFSQEFPCDGRFVGRLQPYSLYVPAKPQPGRGFGLTLLLHGLSGNHNEFLDSDHATQLGERGAGSIVVSPLGRGPDGFYADMAEADVFEVWADVAHRYRLDPEWAASSGYSMGGIGTYRLLYRWPDLFARGAPIVGFADELEQLPSLRHIPVNPWNAGQDELVNPTRYEPTATRLGELGLRFAADVFSPGGHITLASNDEYGPQADFLGEHRVDRDPAHVTYVVSPGRDSARAQAVADHAYWLSGLRARGGAANATVDARSEAFGTGDPPLVKNAPGAGVLTGGTRPLAFTRRSQDWGPAPATPERNALNLNLTAVTAATVTGSRARLRGDEPLTVRVRSDGSGALRVDVPLPAGATVERVEGPAVPGAASRRRSVGSPARRRARAAAAAPEVQLDRTGASFRVAEGSRTYVIGPAQADQPTPPDDRPSSDAERDGVGGSPGDEPGAGSLPFTGLALGLVALLGLALALGGRHLRRRVAP